MSFRAIRRGVRVRSTKFHSHYLLSCTMGPGRSSSLRNGGDSSAVAGSGRTGGASDRSIGVDLRDALGAPPFPLDKGKGRVDHIKYHGGGGGGGGGVRIPKIRRSECFSCRA